MNRILLMGRLTREPEVWYTDGEEPLCIARYTLAVNRRGKPEEADFIRCVVFGKGAEFAERYLEKGTKLMICGRLQTGSYTDRDGKTVYTTDVIVEEQEFAESKKAAEARTESTPKGEDGFIRIPNGLREDGLPFT